MADLFTTLPTELLLPIFKQSPDFSCLWALVTACRKFYIIFTENAAEIVEFILQFSGNTPDQTKHIIRAMVYIRSGSEEWTWMPIVPTGNIVVKMPPFARSTSSPSMFCKLVYLGHRIHGLAHLCIKTCLSRCQYRRLNIPSPTTTSKDTTRPGQLHALTPTWLVEQTAMLSLWHVQYFFELKLVRLRGRLNWPSEELSRLQWQVLHRYFHGDVAEQVMTVVDFLEGLRESGACAVPVDKKEKGESTGPEEQQKAEFAAEASTRHGWSNQTHPFRLPDLSETSMMSNLAWSCKTAPPPTNWLPSSGTTSEDSGQPPAAASNWSNELPQKVSKTWVFFRGENGPSPSTTAIEGNPLRLPMEPFRKFGMFLWDQDLLTQLGLWPRGRDYLRSDEIELYSRMWQTLLTPAEIEQARVAQDDEW